MGGYLVGVVFLVLLGLGMAYEWRKGDLEWERIKPVPPTLKKKINNEKVELANVEENITN
jgi:NADH-quinone oxidoreductase subunit A